MELMQIMQHSDVGDIPQDWRATRIGDYAVKVGSGITPTGGSKVYRSSGRPFVRSQNVGAGRLLLNDIAYIDEQTHRTFDSTEIENGDVLLNITGASIGRSAVADPRIAGGNVNQHVCIIRTSARTVVPRFLNYYLTSRQGQDQIDRFQAGGNRQGLNFQQVRSILLPLPATMAEQEAIAEALSDADAYVASLEQLIAKKRLVKRGAMQELLTGKRRLPGFEVETGTKQTDVGVIPQDWDVRTVGAEFTVQLGKMLDAEKNSGVSKPFLGNRSVQWGEINVSDIGTVKMTPADLKRYRLVDGDLLVCEGGEVGRAAIWRSPIPECYYQKALHRLRPKNGFNVALMRYMIERLATTGILSNFVTQTSIAHLPKDRFEIVPFPCPSTVDERAAIATVLSDMDSEIEAIETQLDKARDIKQGMIQNLLTGRVRLV